MSKINSFRHLALIPLKMALIPKLANSGLPSIEV